ncbi:MAG: 30S ribosomal protein S1 [Candidatus Zixiibacteriota bacterium]|nr:MAG: 30S ribosomal protein S1 [candidate division Zixibacteria bacterium]
MAEAKKKTTAKSKTTGGDKAPKLTKRKATTRRKTKTKKVKMVKTEKAKVAQKAVAVEKKPAEKVQTARTKRLVQKAATRVEKVAVMPEEIETIASMKLTEIDSKEYSQDEYKELLEMYDGTIKAIKEGEIVTGTVLGVSKDDVIVDVGFKSEGIIPLSEFPEPINIAVGDKLDVYLEQIEDSNGQLILSKQRADFMIVWDKIRDIHDAGDLVEGRVVRRIKGGVVVDIMGVDAFLPGSQIALRQVPDFDALIGSNMDLKIIKLNKSRRNIVVSRRVVLEEERESKRESLLKEIEVNQVREGIVKNITDFGVFIDLDGVDGLLHITDMSWGRIKHPGELVTLGEKIQVKILDFDEKTSRISLGLKQLTPYPWENIEEKYPIGKKVTGKVVSITDYGAFVELEKGVEGLIHISEMSWTQHIKHPSKIMNVGDRIDAVVLSVDRENEKISLGIKQMEPDPWETIEMKYPVGKVVSGKVRNLTAFGAFIELEEGIDGLIHISDMSWTKRIQHPSELMKKGDKIDIKILRIDHENRRISLGFKQLKDDPWPDIAKKYSLGTDCLGTITRVMDRGVTVELDGEVEGFVPTHQLGKTDLENPADAFSEGDQIPLQVIEFDRPAHKIVVSVSAYYRKREKTELEQFLAKHPTRTVEMKDAISERPSGLMTTGPAEGEKPAGEPEKPADAAVQVEPEERSEGEKPPELGESSPPESSDRLSQQEESAPAEASPVEEEKKEEDPAPEGSEQT